MDKEDVAWKAPRDIDKLSGDDLIASHVHRLRDVQARQFNQTG